MKILITGVSGFIGERLARRLAGTHTVLGMARSPIEEPASMEFVQGSFDNPEDLQKLDGEQIDAVIHLAAVTGGCSEEDGLAVNVQGTRRLYRYLIGQGCRRFITASSIAAVGCLDAGFIPQQLPIPDDHPCLAKDAYGLSKAMVEEVTRYFHRITPVSEFINLRFGSVVPDESWTPPVIGTDTRLNAPYVLLGRVFASDIVEGLVRIVEAPPADRVLNCNFVGPDSGSTVSSIEMLEALLGDHAADFDLSAYREPDGKYLPLYDMRRMKQEFGFSPVKLTRAIEDNSIL
ncbi:NAD-dependent epimerase/dehydratase family protein [Paenibacillus sepulcri]|uniref:NAD(P)-dependent oxidoreductase n=1 Tax=Paenibacillus sepulcri TaxID=359917 RepID=A0ABS7CFQ1_9BACL|nr:NAD(P)-dependent oxidoreductase [Paenibacillus sepulcri]